MKRPIMVLILAVMVSAPLALLAVPPASVDAQSATTQQVLPDLGMARFNNISIDNSSMFGKRLLRFDATIVNVGGGPFELRGQRADTNSPWTVRQRIYNSDGSYGDVDTPATLIWGGDGHNHWHVNNLESYELDRLDNGVKVGTGAKSGFCFFDSVRYRLTLPGAPQSAQYTSSNSCAWGNQSALEAMLGLSIGWGDLYSHTLPDQYIDITGLTAGRYRLKGTADPSGWFTEGATSNNSTWVDLHIKGRGSSVKILRYGPSA